MHGAKGFLTSLLLLGAFAVPIVTSGCAEQRPYRAYDSYHHDYHPWAGEDAYYRSWYGQNYHDQYRDYRKLNKDEQNRYWDWRHSQSDHDRDHDRDRH